MSDIIKNRSEILFIYDVTDNNPNGDPFDENKPRIDDMGFNIVTDVRLKRTIRDYLQNFRGQEIFVRRDIDNEGKLKTREDIYNEYASPDDMMEKCIDIRLFGGTFTLKNGEAFAVTGPVQFKFGRSLHRVGEPTLIKGTTVFPSAAEKGQGTFWEGYILPYSLIAFYGIINENAAKATKLKEGDINLLLDGIWNGTKNLITRSKVGQMPRLLLRIVYKEKNYHIGELDHRVKLISRIQDEEKIRSITDVEIDITELARVLNENKEKIEKIYFAKDKYLNLIKDTQPIDIDKSVSDITFEQLNF